MHVSGKVKWSVQIVSRFCVCAQSLFSLHPNKTHCFVQNMITNPGHFSCMFSQLGRNLKSAIAISLYVCACNTGFILFFTHDD